MEEKLIGRIKEKQILQEALTSDEAEMISVIGRRRVGKTFLVKTVYKDHLDFRITGVQHVKKAEQLQNFTLQLAKFSDGKFPTTPLKNWLEAFHQLSQFLESKKKTTKMVVFLDEVPWLSTPKSGFLNGLSYFWNSWAVDQNIVVVICGSAASWMIQKVVNHRGGLHNRITKRIQLNPFTLAETEYYFKKRNIHFDRNQIVQIYMAMGGIPHYLKEINAGESASQNINRICFAPTGLLIDEFSRLYPSLFAKADNHIAIIRTLAKKRKGLTRQLLVESTKLSESGTINRTLEELSESGFISSYRPFGKKKKEKLFRLTDEYSLFYLSFIEGKEHEGDDVWHHLSQTQNYKIWSGYSFESICLKHIRQIKKALGISGIYSLSGSFYKKGTASIDGTQIDLLIDRKDHVINLFEIKFYNKTFTINKSYAEKLEEKMRIYQESTKTNKQLFWVFITTFGLKPNMYSSSLVAKTLTLDDLFVEL